MNELTICDLIVSALPVLIIFAVMKVIREIG